MGDLKKCVLKMDMTKSLAQEDQNVLICHGGKCPAQQLIKLHLENQYIDFLVLLIPSNLFITPDNVNGVVEFKCKFFCLLL